MINIMFCGNKKVLPGVLTAMLSIFERSQDKSGYCFYILTMDLTRKNKDFLPLDEDDRLFLNSVARSYSPDNQVLLYDVGDLYENEMSHSPNEGCYCSPYTLLRLLTDLIPGIPDKLLYLDADLMFVKDIHLLYDIDVTDYEYAAAPDCYGKWLISNRYINAGVLLFNVKKMKENDTFGKARTLIRKRHLPFADQSALMRSTTAKKMLPQYYNDQHQLRSKTIVRHFAKRLYLTPYPHTENIKQWNIKRVHDKLHYHQFDDIYAIYEKLLKERSVQNETTRSNSNLLCN